MTAYLYLIFLSFLYRVRKRWCKLMIDSEINFIAKFSLYFSDKPVIWEVFILDKSVSMSNFYVSN